MPSFEDASILGIVYDSVAFPEQDGTHGPVMRLTVRAGRGEEVGEQLIVRITKRVYSLGI